MTDHAFNIKMSPLPEGYTPLEVVAVVKSLDEDGEPCISLRTSQGLMEWEALGMFIAGADMARADLRASFSTTETEDESSDDDGHE